MPNPVRAIVPEGMEELYHHVKMSPAIVSGDHIFLTGVTGAGTDGTMPSDPEAQFRAVFEKIRFLLQQGGVDCDAIVEMTSYHLGIAEHFDLFSAVRAEYVSDPYPAWTAVEVAGIRRAGAIVEVRVVARAA